MKIHPNQAIKNGYQYDTKPANSTEECRNRCCSQARCQTFNYYKDIKTCGLREANIDNKRYPDTNVDSGWKVQYPPSTISKCSNLTVTKVIPYSCDPVYCKDPLCKPSECSPVDFIKEDTDKYVPKYMRVNYTGGIVNTNTDPLRELIEECTPSITNVPIASTEHFLKIMMKWANNKAYLTKDAPELMDPIFRWDPEGNDINIGGTNIIKSTDFVKVYQFLHHAVCYTALAETIDNDSRYNGGKSPSPDYPKIWDYVQSVFDMYISLSIGMYDPKNYSTCCGPNGIYWHFIPKIWLSYKNNRFTEDIDNLRIFMYALYDNYQLEIVGRRISTFEDGFLVPEWQRSASIADYNYTYMKYLSHALYFYAVTLPRNIFNLLIRDPLKDEIKKVIDRLTDPENHKDNFNNDYYNKYFPIHKAIDEKFKAMFGQSAGNGSYSSILRNGIPVPKVKKDDWLVKMYTILFEQDSKEPLPVDGLIESQLSPVNTVYAVNGIRKIHRQKGRELIVPTETELAELERISKIRHPPVTLEEHVCRFRYQQIYDNVGNKLPTYTGPMPCP